MADKKVAVIGAGTSGIFAIKSLLEEGIEPVCFEKTAYYGGLWHYHEEDVDGLASVMKTTVINTSKEMSAFSDMPPPDDYPNFMHNREVYQYITAYVNKFDVLKYILYNKEVIRVVKSENYESNGGQLKLTVRDTETAHEDEYTFDGVLVCTGHHVYPNIPSFPGTEIFKGRIMHTHSLKRVNSFVDQSVVVVGVGNSGIDAAVEISSVAKQVYLSTRRGTWLIRRVGPSGLPFDMFYTSRFLNSLFEISPLKISSWIAHESLNKWFDHSLYNLKPKHSIFGQHPTVSDTLPVKLISGVVRLRSNIKSFAEDGVVFEKEGFEKVDSVILATGYTIKFPFLSDDLMSVQDDNSVHLYKFMYPPHLSQNTLAVIGLVQAVGAVFPMEEAQCRLAASVLSGRTKLPDRKAMEEDIKRHRESMGARYVTTQRHTIQADYIPYLDEICELFGAKPNLFKILFTDPKLYFSLIFGPSLPYQYRLQGPHSWSGARDAILSYKERVLKPLGNGS